MIVELSSGFAEILPVREQWGKICRLNRVYLVFLMIAYHHICERGPMFSCSQFAVLVLMFIMLIGVMLSNSGHVAQDFLDHI